MIVLDTHTWLWWVSQPDQRSRSARAAIAREEPRDGLLLSAISVWEVAVKTRLGKLQLDRELRAWTALATRSPGLVVVPLNAQDALESTVLSGEFHRDPGGPVHRRAGAPDRRGHRDPRPPDPGVPEGPDDLVSGSPRRAAQPVRLLRPRSRPR